jgi:hypothetical protein
VVEGESEGCVCEREIRASGKENGECAAKDEKEQGKGEAHQGPRREYTNRSRPHLTVSDIFLLSRPKRPRKREWARERMMKAARKE